MSGPLRTRSALIATAACLVAGVLAAPASAVSPQARTPGLEFLGEHDRLRRHPSRARWSAACPPGRTTRPVTSTTRSPTTRAEPSPPRAPRPGSTRLVDLPDGSLGAGDVTVVDVTTLLGADGQPFPARSLDPEGLTLTRDDTLIITSEGVPAVAGPPPVPAFAPFVREFDLSGRQIAVLAGPKCLHAVGRRDPRGASQPRLRGAAVAPNGQFLFVGAENALAPRTVRPPAWPREAEPGCCATTFRTATWTGSTSTRPTRSSRRARSSPSTVSWSCCR